MISLYYPATGVATASIELRNPEYGDSEQFDSNVLFHLGMTGDVFSYKKKLKQVILLNISGVTKAKIEEFETFYLAVAGSIIGYTDNLGRNWLVQITNEPLETVTNTGAGDCQLHSFTLQMRATGGEASTEYTLVDDDQNVLVDDAGNELTYT